MRRNMRYETEKSQNLRIRQDATRFVGRRKKMASLSAIATALTVFSPVGANAFRLDTSSEDLLVRWDTTVKYSAGWRVKDKDTQVLGSSFNPNLDDGDRNFGKGLISNRLDLLSELDVTYNNLGFRLSGAAWYDDVYKRSTDNDSPMTFNAASVPSGQFTKATEKLHGQKVELLDAFVFGKFTPGDSVLTLRAGRFAQLYGESLFFGSNGIATAQSSPDIVKLLSVPSSQFKEILRPTGQVAAQLQISPRLSVGGYYQYEWRAARLPAVGSYHSFADFPGAGGERVIVGPPIAPGGGPAAFFRATDLGASDSGQGGLQLRYKHNDWEYGFYAARFHDKFPQFYFRPGAGTFDPAAGRVGEYVQVFGEGIKTYGASASTVIGDMNVAGEVSLRHDMPLAAVGNVVVDPTATGDGKGNPLYPVGKTFHAQVSAISVLPASDFWDGAAFMGEVAFNRRLSVDRNASRLDPNSTRDATALRFIFQPEYFQVMRGVDIQIPLGLSWGVSGRSSVNGIGFPAEHGGDISVGVKADFEKIWQASLTYTHYYGRAAAAVNPTGELSFGQQLKDRNFIALSVQRTF